MRISTIRSYALIVMGIGLIVKGFTTYEVRNLNPVSYDVSASTSISASFSPGSAEGYVLSVINGARNTLSVAAYSFTSQSVADALIAAHDRGVDVLVVVDNDEGVARYSKIPLLVKHLIEVRYDSQYAIMHNKFIVSDGTTVETGSFNYSSSAANRNAENVIIINKDSDIADIYEKEFSRLWHESSVHAGPLRHHNE